MDKDSWRRVVETNLSGPFYCIKRFGVQMQRQKKGVIVNISSLAGIRGNNGQANYSAAKAGLIALTRTAALEFEPFNIRVNAVIPPITNTDMVLSILKNKKDSKIQEKIVSPDKIADAVAFLCSDEADYITGQVLTFDNRLKTDFLWF
jgi:3-oxoacyl-[acyl-carrier protein] reductase